MADEPIYSERYVAFIDILGFSDIVRQSVVYPWQAEQLVGILERISGRTSQLEYDKMFGDDFRAQSFSDCIVLSERATSAGLEHLLFAVSQLALDLLANGILTRGAIAKGKLHHTDKIVFGPALVEAYRIESTIAVFPRIVIEREAHRDFKSMVEAGRKTFIASGFEAEVRHDDDAPLPRYSIAFSRSQWRNTGTPIDNCGSLSADYKIKAGRVHLRSKHLQEASLANNLLEWRCHE